MIPADEGVTFAESDIGAASRSAAPPPPGRTARMEGVIKDPLGGSIPRKKPIEWARPSRASMWLAFTGERWRVASVRAKNEFAPFVQLLIRQTGLGSAGEGRVPHTAAFRVEINTPSLTFLQTRSGSVHPWLRFTLIAHFLFWAQPGDPAAVSPLMIPRPLFPFHPTPPRCLRPKRWRCRVATAAPSTEPGAGG